MKSVEEFKTYYDAELLPDLQRLDEERKGISRAAVILIFACLADIAIGIVLVTMVSQSDEMIFTAIALWGSAILAGIIVGIILGRKYKRFKIKYKETVVTDMIHFFDPNLNYFYNGKITKPEYQESKLFLNRVDLYNGEDMIEGTLGQTKLKFSELHTQYRTTNHKGQTQYHTVFRGVFFIADFNKNFEGETYVLPDTAEKLFGKLGNFFQKMNVGRPDLVKLENVEFEKAFAVYGTDQIESRYILSPKLMEDIMELKKKAPGAIRLSFRNSNVYIAITSFLNLFEPRLFKTIVDFKHIQKYFEFLRMVLLIVEDLGLNTRIWTKGGAAPPPPPQAPPAPEAPTDAPPIPIPGA